TATGMDAHSMVVDPLFSDLDNPRACNDSLDGAALPISYITDDFEGDERNMLTPDIGADEFFGISSFSAGPDGLMCGTDGVEIGLENGAIDSVFWSTGDSTNTITVF